MAIGSIICGANAPKAKRKKAKVSEHSWIDSTFEKLECTKYIASKKRALEDGEKDRCLCGYSYTHHLATGADVSETLEEKEEEWSPSANTRKLPTDAYGTIEFQGGPHPTKAQFLRLAYDTRPELIVQLLCREWKLGLPKLLITIHGGRTNFELQPTLKKVLRKGLLKAAKTTGAWIFTGGTNTGITKQVGDALMLERSQRQGRVVSIGIAPWGMLEKNHELISRGGEVPYDCVSSPWYTTKNAVLNNRHAYFLLADSGTEGQYGLEIVLRRRLEKYISNLKLQPYTHSSIPVVALVIEGGVNTIRAVLEYVTSQPPVPVVVCDGSGRAADIIAFMHKYALAASAETDEDRGEKLLDSIKDDLIDSIRQNFKVSHEIANKLYLELRQCCYHKHLITVFRLSQEKPQELDQTILTALFKSQQLSPAEQLSMALIWNRVDIARSEIFVYGQQWPPGALEQAMMQALQHDRIDFVKLLLENGVSMRKFLTIPRLEELYNSKEGPTNTMGYILRDVRPNIPRGYMYTLHDIGLVINKLMGGAYRSKYTLKDFRMEYARVMKRSGGHPQNVHRNSCAFGSVSRFNYQKGGKKPPGVVAMTLAAQTLPGNKNTPIFDHPFNELLIWAVLTKRQQMALLMWQHGEEALAKSLVGLKLYKAMAHEAAEDDLETEIYEELRGYGKEFENIALELLDFCYRQDDDQAQQLLTSELQNWSGQTCLSLAVTANHRALLAHACSQILLADLWMGGLRTRKNTNLKVVLGLLCPPYITQLEFKSREELQLMPQTQEEHFMALEDENDDSDSEPGATTRPDIEKRPQRCHSIREKTAGQQGVKALIANSGNNAPMIKDTVVHENGKVLADEECERSYSILSDYYDNKNMRPLRLRKKLYEFYTAPIAKFWSNSIAYIVFLVQFSYCILVKMNERPSWAEIYAISYICTLGFEKMREIATSEPVTLTHKFSVWAWNMWNPCDAAAVIFFQIGLVLRVRTSTFEVGRVIYCVDCIYWYLRILNILGVNKYLGPLVTMMGKMIKNMIYFVVLLCVVLMSFGVARQAILNPNSPPKWRILRDIFLEPYFMLYGEVYADNIDPDCGDEPGMIACLPGRWITPVAMSIYLLLANILLINLLIAVFNNIFNEVNAVAHQVWMFQRFTVVMEYEQKPVLPPPFIVVSHIYLLMKYLARCVAQGASGAAETYDNGLKLFLQEDDRERLNDFEEDCVEGYFREQELKLQMSTEERIKLTTERVENMNQKIEDIDSRGNAQNSTLQAVDFRLRKLEELNEQTASQLGVIHRFMSTHTSNDRMPGGTLSSSLDISVDLGMQQRRVSERLENDGIHSEGDAAPLTNVPLRRKKFGNLAEARFQRAIFQNREADEEEEPANDEDSPRQILTSDEQPTTTNSSGPRYVQQDSSSTEDARAPFSRSRSSDEDKAASVQFPRDPAIPETRRNSTVSVGTRDSRANRRTRSESHSDEVTLAGSMGALLPRERGVTWGADPRLTARSLLGRPVSSNYGQRPLLVTMHARYTSITDELEGGILPQTPPISPPPTSRGRLDRAFTMGTVNDPERARQMENEHLREAEECDYQLMEDLCFSRKFNSKESEESNPEEFYLDSSSICENVCRIRKRHPTICITTEIEQTLARPRGLKDIDTEQSASQQDAETGSLSAAPAPSSETMC